MAARYFRRRLCREVHLNLAYCCFCRLGLDSEVPDHSTFSKNRHGRFPDCDLLQKLFETVVRRCMTEGLIDEAASAVDASLIAADANKRRALRPGLMMLTGRPSPGRAGPSGNISIPSMRLLGEEEFQRYEQGRPDEISEQKAHLPSPERPAPPQQDPRAIDVPRRIRGRGRTCRSQVSRQIA
ncbi:hypothetical protein ACVMHR_010170 [Bradyrhizobium diazoefficiens]